VLESRIVDLSDEIAYTCHDLEDGLRSGILTWEMLDAAPIAGGSVTIGVELRRIANARADQTGRTLRDVVVNAIKNRLVSSVIACVRAEIASRNVDSPAAARKQPRELVRVPDPERVWYDALRKFVYKNFYESWRMMRMARKARHIMTALFEAYCTTPEMLPPETQARMASGTDSTERVICDYLAGMTDRFCGEEFQRLFEPFTRV
jgi:dGTPase